MDRKFSNLISSALGQLEFQSLKPYTPELKFLVQIYLWYKKLYQNDSSIGLEIYKLRFYDSRHRNQLNQLQKFSFLIEPIIDYIRNRTIQRLNSKIWEMFFAVLSLLEWINTFIFIYDGKHATLYQRLFSISTIPVGKIHTSIGSSYLHRELLWQSLSQVLTYTLPILYNMKWIRNNIQKLVAMKQSIGTSTNDVEANSCHLCKRPPINANQFLNCCHVYCHYCIMSHLIRNDSFLCSKCNVSVRSSEELSSRFMRN